MEDRMQDPKDEVIAQNRLAASSQREAPLDDPDVMYVLETAVGGNCHRIYELGLGRVIARIAEDLARMEAELEALRAGRDAEGGEPVTAGAPAPRRGHGRLRPC